MKNYPLRDGKWLILECVIQPGHNHDDMFLKKRQNAIYAARTMKNYTDTQMITLKLTGEH